MSGRAGRSRGWSVRGKRTGGETVDKAEVWQTEARSKVARVRTAEGGKELLAGRAGWQLAMYRPINMKDDIIRRSQIKTACPACTCVNYAEFVDSRRRSRLFTYVYESMKEEIYVYRLAPHRLDAWIPHINFSRCNSTRYLPHELDQVDPNDLSSLYKIKPRLMQD